MTVLLAAAVITPNTCKGRSVGAEPTTNGITNRDAPHHANTHKLLLRKHIHRGNQSGASVGTGDGGGGGGVTGTERGVAWWGGDP